MFSRKRQRVTNLEDVDQVPDDVDANGEFDSDFMNMVTADAEDYEEFVPVEEKRRLKNKRLMTDNEVKTEEQDVSVAPAEMKDSSLLKQHMDIKKKSENEDKRSLQLQNQIREENMILKELSNVQTRALQSRSDVAQGIKYTESLKTDWRPPSYITTLGEKRHELTRSKWNIQVEGVDVPPPIKSFREMKLPTEILTCLSKSNILNPTPIQVQGLPVALSGRDMIGIAFTGSGKTITFLLPLLCSCLAKEEALPIEAGEGPFGLILCPSRELARQTFDVTNRFLSTNSRLSQLRCLLVMGGESKSIQKREWSNGVHIVIATTGRLLDILDGDEFDSCRPSLSSVDYLVLDEGDRMIDLGFDEEVQRILAYISNQHQTLLFSATMPSSLESFCSSSLVQPIIVHVGRVGAANLDVIQEVEYVKEDAKILYLLMCLNKTPPSVLIFARSKTSVDMIHEYLLLKGVKSAAVHGDLSQSDRDSGIQGFKSGDIDVLVATDVAAKGLDFPSIRHVINFDMPEDTETYIHRIGRTGRCGHTGVATTFINNSTPELLLLDLKQLLVEANQRLPPVLSKLSSHDTNVMSGMTCPLCGGPTHSLAQCPKKDKYIQKNRDSVNQGSGW